MSLKGTLVFASGFSVNFDIWTLELESGRMSQLTTGDDWHDSPSWSPDGSKIAFLARKDDLLSSVWVMNRDGSNKQQLTSGMSCAHPSWAPDGESLLFAANIDDPNEIDIYSLSLSGNAIPQQMFHRTGTELSPVWSSDGKRILFAAIPPEEVGAPMSINTEVWEYDIDMQKFKKLTDHGARDYGPKYSPDGSRIAFVSHRQGHNEEEYLQKVEELKTIAAGGDMRRLNEGIRSVQKMEEDSDIWVMNADGSNVRQLTSNAGADIGVAWSPCSSYLVYTAAPSGKSTQERIRIVDAESGSDQGLSYDRELLRGEMQARIDALAPQGFFRRLIPDIIERRLIDRSIWGEERQPDWTQS